MIISFKTPFGAPIEPDPELASLLDALKNAPLEVQAAEIQRWQKEQIEENRKRQSTFIRTGRFIDD